MKTPMDRLLDGIDWQPVNGHVIDVDGDIPVATHSGVLRIGDVELRCYQLDNGQRVFDVDDIARFFGMETDRGH